MIKALVIGEICEDIFIYGDCKRLSPEAPVPVLNPIETTYNPGMSGNVVENLKSLDEDIVVYHWHQTERVTKTRFVDKKSNHMFLRVDEGESNIVPMNFSQDVLNDLEDFDFVIVSDYDKGFLNENWLKNIGRRSKLSILDTKKKLSKEVVDSFTFVKLNEHETKLNKDLENCENIITTLGSKGAKFKGVHYESPNPKDTIDVSGAGDTFTASFILEYYRTNDINKSMVFANEMASIVVSKRGVTTPK